MLAATAVAILPALAPSFRCPLAIVGEITARGLPAFVARSGGPFTIVGEVAWVGFLGTAALTGSLLILRHVVSPCDGLAMHMKLCHALLPSRRLAALLNGFAGR